jgi:hypothetical protein
MPKKGRKIGQKSGDLRRKKGAKRAKKAVIYAEKRA